MKGNKILVWKVYRLTALFSIFYGVGTVMWMWRFASNTLIFPNCGPQLSGYGSISWAGKKSSFSAVYESTQRYLNQTATSSLTKDWFGIQLVAIHRCFRFLTAASNRGLMSCLCYLPGWAFARLNKPIHPGNAHAVEMLCHLSLPVFLLSPMLPAMSLHSVVLILHKERWKPASAKTLR